MKSVYHATQRLSGLFCCLLGFCLLASTNAWAVVSQNDGEQGSADNDDPLESRVDLVMVLDDQKINLLRQSGGLQVTVPDSYRDRINSLVIKQRESFLDQPLVLPDDAERVGDKVLCNIDQSILSHLHFQPIRIQIYHSNFESVLIRFKADEQILPSQLQFDSSKDSVLVWANLKDGRSLPGMIENGRAIKFQSQLGERAVPWESISMVELGDKNVILLANGDRLAGKLLVQQFEWLTRWGTRTFDISDLDSITRSGPDSRKIEKSANQNRKQSKQ